ncbi:LuxR C-terminal-related transcriptional regulator [Novosphingobium sp. PASSN1]|uniref:response regulator transcription factor n=1 Tax=Novosphingobium sp. PASSN1 TaxID=2015561 RepID=UPI000BC63B96|nr:LuxR C-terminal-related transcriptional regulator [Novosphingobium sp. PASSN1]OYU34296.1 MAG: helix-turn-helix transcriptional regulator [Novosphingobium sp. PASSN1]
MAYMSNMDAFHIVGKTSQLFGSNSDDFEKNHGPVIKGGKGGDRDLLAVHLIDPDSHLRAKLARRLLDLDRHVEIYSSPAELIEFSPQAGIVLINEVTPAIGVSYLVESITSPLRGLPVIVYSMIPSVENAVAAMKAHALNYFDMTSDDTCLVSALDEAMQHSAKHRERIGAIEASIRRIGLLSMRERQVLELIVQGCSNKDVARKLELSPRTVEIHRMHMMCKLNTKSCAEAVKIWCIATRSILV